MAGQGAGTRARGSKAKGGLAAGAAAALVALLAAPDAHAQGGKPVVVPLRGEIPDVVNVLKLQEIRARQPKACGPMEISPGNWIRVDCHTYPEQAVKAISHFSNRKLKMAKAGKLSFTPLKLTAKQLKVRTRVPGGGGAGAAAGVEKAGGLDDAAQGSKSSGTVASNFPGTVDHRAMGLEGPVRNQGSVGSCTAFAMATTLDNQLLRAGIRDATSATHVWSYYGFPSMGKAADATLGKAVAPNGTWSYVGKEACKIADPVYEDCGSAYGVVPGTWRSDSALMTKHKAATSAAKYKISAIERLNVLPADPSEVVQALSSGNSLWVAFKIDGNKWTNRAMSGGVIPDWYDYSGGHAVVMSGYRSTPSGKQFLIHNSWGESWGDKGYAWVSEAMVKKFMHHAYKVKLGGAQKPKELTDDDCGPDDLVDGVTGQCAPICPDDSRPMDGC